MYKIYLVFIGLFLALSSCQKQDADSFNQDIFISENNKLLMLKVDHQTFEFEGAIELNFNSLVVSDTIPMDIVFNEPGDFGDISITHIPTGEPIFFGTIVWNGLGERTFPEQLLEPSAFLNSNLPVETPSEEDVKFISPYTMESGITPAVDYANPWSNISNLLLVEQYISNGAKVALIEYMPSVGMGNPAEWDWYFLLYL